MRSLEEISKNLLGNLKIEIPFKMTNTKSPLRDIHEWIFLQISKNKSSQYSNLSDSDGGPSSPKKTDATELKIDKSLQNFIEALPRL